MLESNAHFPCLYVHAESWELGFRNLCFLGFSHFLIESNIKKFHFGRCIKGRYKGMKGDPLPIETSSCKRAMISSL